MNKCSIPASEELVLDYMATQGQIDRVESDELVFEARLRKRLNELLIRIRRDRPGWTPPIED